MYEGLSCSICGSEHTWLNKQKSRVECKECGEVLLELSLEELLNCLQFTRC